MRNLFDISGKTAVITGGSGVLGNAMTRYLAAQGVRTAVLARNETKGNALVSEIRAEGGEAMFLRTDVTDREILERNCRDILSAYGKIDMLINCAGGNMPGATVPPEKTIFDLNIEDFREVVDLNLFGTVIPTLVFAGAMRNSGGGPIVNMSSESALRPLTRVAGYGAAKAAVTNFTRYLASELALKFGDCFRVNAMAPGFFLTEQNRTLMTNPDGSRSARAESILAHTPFGRFGEPEELLGTLHYLVSDASRFVTGTVIVIDGGFDAFSI